MIHVVMPFSRPRHALALAEMMRWQGVIWHPICHSQQDIDSIPKFHWIRPRLIHGDLIPEIDYCVLKIIWFRDNTEIVDDDWYAFMCDDDGYPAYFMDVVNWREIGVDAVVVSMLRGNVSHGMRHGTSTLVAEPGCMRGGNVGWEQFIVRGRIYSTYQIGGDGAFAEEMAAKGARIEYAPHFHVCFNLFERGRWHWPRNQVDPETRRVMKETNVCEWHPEDDYNNQDTVIAEHCRSFQAELIRRRGWPTENNWRLAIKKLATGCCKLFQRSNTPERSCEKFAVATTERHNDYVNFPCPCTGPTDFCPHYNRPLKGRAWDISRMLDDRGRRYRAAWMAQRTVSPTAQSLVIQ